MLPENFEPMLASPLKDGAMPKFPCLLSTKLDGVRAVVFGGVVYSRKLKPFRNKYIQELYGQPEYEGFDGEITVGPPNAEDVMRRTQSMTSSFDKWDHDNPPVLRVFDIVDKSRGFKSRLAELRRLAKKWPPSLALVEQHEVKCEEELTALEEFWLSQGFEGAMARPADGPYKFGRSTVNEGFLLKVKRFEDAEAVVLSVEELQHNMNEATKNELGRIKRTSHKSGKVGGGTCGALHVRGINGVYTGVEFDIGSGFTDEVRREIWDGKRPVVGERVTYRYFPSGSKERPRFPVFVGFRYDLE